MKGRKITPYRIGFTTRTESNGHTCDFRATHFNGGGFDKANYCILHHLSDSTELRLAVTTKSPQHGKEHSITGATATKYVSVACQYSSKMRQFHSPPNHGSTASEKVAGKEKIMESGRNKEKSGIFFQHNTGNTPDRVVLRSMKRLSCSGNGECSKGKPQAGLASDWMRLMSVTYVSSICFKI